MAPVAKFLSSFVDRTMNKLAIIFKMSLIGSRLDGGMFFEPLLLNMRLFLLFFIFNYYYSFELLKLNIESLSTT